MCLGALSYVYLYEPCSTFVLAATLLARLDVMYLLLVSKALSSASACLLLCERGHTVLVLFLDLPSLVCSLQLEFMQDLKLRSGQPHKSTLARTSQKKL